MQRRTFIASATALAAATALITTAKGNTMTTRPASGYAPVNGIELYYEIHGEGKPLVLLHGGFGAIEMFGPALTALAATRQVIGVDLQAHGRTVPFDRPMTFQNMATDIAELIKWLGYDKADVMGYSLGGGAALRTAIDHPEIVDRLVLVSTPYAFSGWHDYNQQGMKQIAAGGGMAAEGMKQTPMYELYKQIAPDVNNWNKAVAQIGSLVGTEYDWSASIPGLKPETLLIVGDYDAVRISHATAFFELLGGGKKDAGWDGSGMTPNHFAVIPGATHYNIFMDQRLLPMALPFLDAAKA